MPAIAFIEDSDFHVTLQITPPLRRRIVNNDNLLLVVHFTVIALKKLAKL
jgi:hypothetical protein